MPTFTLRFSYFDAKTHEHKVYVKEFDPQNSTEMTIGNLLSEVDGELFNGTKADGRWFLLDNTDSSIKPETKFSDIVSMNDNICLEFDRVIENEKSNENTFLQETVVDPDEIEQEFAPENSKPHEHKIVSIIDASERKVLQEGADFMVKLEKYNKLDFVERHEHLMKKDENYRKVNNQISVLLGKIQDESAEQQLNDLLKDWDQNLENGKVMLTI